MLTLRPYQAAAVDALLAHPPGGPRGALLVASVGAGKTEMGLSAAVQVLDQGGRVVWGAHRRELLDQPYQRLMRHWPKHAFRAGTVQGGRDAVDARMVFASIATITRPKRLADVLKHGQPDLLVVDEVHHATSTSYQPILDAFRGVRRIGLTATVDREDGSSLADQWDVVYSYDIADAVRDGWLVEPYAHRYHMPANVERSVNTGRLDKEDTGQEAADLLRHVVGHTVRALGQPVRAERLPWRDDRQIFDLRQRSGIVFCSTIAQARATAEALCADGWVARSISGDPTHTDLEQRALLLREYSAGRVQVLCNADLLTEGFDAPRTGFVVYARATRSRPLFVQALGRAMRLFDAAWPGSPHEMNRTDPRYRGRLDCVAVDLVGCTEEHSIIAAPVLVGEACAHAWVPTPFGGATCPTCEGKRACWESLQRGRDGTHTFTPGAQPVCRWCQRAQCPDSETGRHVWRRAEDHRFVCDACPAEYTDPLASLIKGRNLDKTEDVRFVEGDALGSGEVALVCVRPASSSGGEVWAVDLDAHGLILLSGVREGLGWWSVRWDRPAVGTLEVGPGGYSTRHAWAVAADVIRQTARRKLDAAKGREVWGGLDEAGRADLVERALRAMGVADAA